MFSNVLKLIRTDSKELFPPMECSKEWLTRGHKSKRHITRTTLCSVCVTCFDTHVHRNTTDGYCNIA